MNKNGKMKKMLEKLALCIAAADANSSCACITYQPKQSEVIKKLRRH